MRASVDSLLSDFQKLVESANSKEAEWDKSTLGISTDLDANSYASLMSIDVFALAGSFVQAGGNSSVETLRGAYFLGMSPGSFIPNLKLADISKYTLEQLNPFQQNILHGWMVAPLKRPSSVSSLQQLDKNAGTTYASETIVLFRRLATFFLHAEGPPSQEGQRVFNDYEKLLAREDFLVAIKGAWDAISGPHESKIEELATGTFLPSPHCKSKKEAIFWLKKGPQNLLELDVSEVMLRVMASDGVATAAHAQLYLDVVDRLIPNSPVNVFPSDSLLDYVNKMASQESYRRPYDKPWSLVLMEEYDTTNGTHLSDQERGLLMRTAMAAASVCGPPSVKAKAEIELVAIALREGKAIDKTGQATTCQTNDSAPATETLIAELKSLIGLNGVKEDVAELANYIKVGQLRRAKGLKSPEISLHMVFHGNPGTGKTTVARLLSQIYKALGVVSKGHLVETDRSDLVAGYVGQTALKVKAVAEKALGGILFIDEAYALKRSDDQQDFGNEAIETLLKFMEDNRQDLVVIVAGYPVEMKRFIDANPGLQSRFNKSLTFPDYTPEELTDIFLRLCNESDYKLSEAARARLSAYFAVAYQNRDLKFGNARLVRNIFEKVITNLANRIIQDSHADSSTLELIEDADIIVATATAF